MAPRNALLEKELREAAIDDEDREFYGPIDGVLPQDHDFHSMLLDSVCLTRNKTYKFPFYRHYTKKKLLCTRCYTSGAPIPGFACFGEFHEMTNDEQLYINCCVCRGTIIVAEVA